MRNRLTFALIVVSLAGAIAVSAQTTENFEVASVRPDDRPGGPQFGPCSGGVELTSGRIAINAATVYRLVTLAYGMYCPAATNPGARFRWSRLDAEGDV